MIHNKEAVEFAQAIDQMPEFVQADAKRLAMEDDWQGLAYIANMAMRRRGSDAIPYQTIVDLIILFRDYR